ncbi:MAG: hypothetical protein ACLT98_00355 [Eggerthellaceae bacterium]
MLAEAALEHARADAEYFDEDFRMRATEGIDMWAVARKSPRRSRRPSRRRGARAGARTQALIPE